MSKAQNSQKISFDTENDNPVDDIRTIKVMKKDIEKTFLVQLYAAGGDWQMPANYFRIQQESPQKMFVWIPSKEQGNGNLVKSKNGYEPEDHQYKKDDDRDDKKCWEVVEKYIEKTNP